SDLPSRDARSAPRVAEHRETDSRLPGARLSDESEDLTSGDSERNAVDDVLVAAVVELDPQVDDVERGGGHTHVIRLPSCLARSRWRRGRYRPRRGSSRS